MNYLSGGNSMKRPMITVLVTGTLLLSALPAAVQAQSREPFAFRFDRSPRRSWLGVSIQDMTAKLAKAKGTKVDEGALVSEVEKKSPADSAGIQEGDIITEFDGRKIYDADDLTKTVGRTKAGTTVSVVLDRKGSTKTVKVTVGKNRARVARAFSFSGPEGNLMTFGRSKAIGANLRPLSEQLGEYFQVPDGKGILVESVEKGTAADKAGLKAGDVIVKVGDERVTTMGELWDAIGDFKEGEKADLEVIRKGQSKKFTVEIEEGGENNWYEFHSRPRIHGEEDGEEGEDVIGRMPEMRLDGLMPELRGLRLNLDRLRDIRLKREFMPELPKIEINPRIRIPLRERI
jgi:predicted metalloprotease with PDZ domain